MVNNTAPIEATQEDNAQPLNQRVDDFISKSPSVRLGAVTPQHLQELNSIKDEISDRRLVGIGQTIMGGVCVIASLFLAALPTELPDVSNGILLPATGLLGLGIFQTTRGVELYEDASTANKKLNAFINKGPQ